MMPSKADLQREIDRLGLEKARLERRINQCFERYSRLEGEFRSLLDALGYRLEHVEEHTRVAKVPAGGE